MRDVGVFNIRRALPRMSWSKKNLYNLWARTAGPKSAAIQFRSTAGTTVFQQRWKSKAAIRAFHGDFIPEKIFKRWYLPETIPDVRPRRQISGDDKDSLEEFARRKKREKELEDEIETKGMAPVGSLMLTEVERRIDVFIFRCCFAHSVYEARRLVIHGDVLINGKKHTDANTRLAPGDMVSVNPSAIRLFKKPETHIEHEDISATLESQSIPPGSKRTPFYLPTYASPWLFIPAYIEPSFSTCSAVYVRHPTARPGYSEVPTPYDADGPLMRYAWEWYVERRPRMRSKSQLARMPLDRALLQTKNVHEERKMSRANMERVTKKLAQL